MAKPNATSGTQVPFTAFPNVLLDEVMPTLKDTEWRVLCVIVRQTLGWSDGKGGRKERDWLSQKQLMVRTGRNSAALSAAVEELVRRRLVEAWDEQGNLLLTPQDRQHQKRVYYGLHPGVLTRGTTTSQILTIASPVLPTSEIPLRKANTTKETEDKRKSIKRKAFQRKDTKQKTNKKGEEDLSPLRIHTGWTKASDVSTKWYSPKLEKS